MRLRVLRLNRSLVCFAVVALSAVNPAFAESTTGTTITVSGQPAAGRQVTVHATVTGKHLVFVPPTSVNSGYVEITLNGALVARVQAAAANSSGIEAGQCIPDPTLTFCVTYKYPAQQTDVIANVALPAGVSNYTFAARFTGDADSHSSDATPVVLRAVYPGALAPLSLLFK